MSGLKIGVIGATGMVGRQYLEILEASPLEIGAASAVRLGAVGRIADDVRRRVDRPSRSSPSRRVAASTSRSSRSRRSLRASMRPRSPRTARW